MTAASRGGPARPADHQTAHPVAQQQGGGRRFRRRALAVVVLALASTLLLGLLGANQELLRLLNWVDALGFWGPPLFVVLHAAAVVVLLPGIAFPLAAGFLFGPVWGSVYSALGKALGALLAFVIARNFAGTINASDWWQALRKRRPTLATIDDHIAQGGWRAVLLVRLVALIPFKLSNYVFGWTRVGIGSYLLGTLLGVIPYSISNAVVGSLAGELALRGVRPATSDPRALAALAGAGALAVGAAVVIAFFAGRRLGAATATRGASEDRR